MMQEHVTEYSGRKPLTGRQERLFNAIVEYIDREGFPPSVRDLMAASGLRSTSAVVFQLEALAGKGYIRRGSNRSRAISVVSS